MYRSPLVLPPAADHTQTVAVNSVNATDTTLYVTTGAGAQISQIDGFSPNNANSNGTNLRFSGVQLDSQGNNVTVANGVVADETMTKNAGLLRAGGTAISVSGATPDSFAAVSRTLCAFFPFVRTAGGFTLFTATASSLKMEMMVTQNGWNYPMACDYAYYAGYNAVVRIIISRASQAACSRARPLRLVWWCRAGGRWLLRLLMPSKRSQTVMDEQSPTFLSMPVPAPRPAPPPVSLSPG